MRKKLRVSNYSARKSLNLRAILFGTQFALDEIDVIGVSWQGLETKARCLGRTTASSLGRLAVRDS
jgi:hypothetical protein